MPWMQTVFFIQAAAAVVMVVAALSLRFGWLDFKLAFLVFMVAGLFLTVGAVASVVAMCVSKGFESWPQLVIGLLPSLAFLAMVGGGGLKVPPIHDISTRQTPPLVFVHADTLRKPGENSIEPAGEDVVRAQRGYYPHIKTLELSADSIACFAKLQSAVHDLGWTVTAQDTAHRWLEAYETSTLLGFKDDVRVELTALAEGRCAVDVRSVSRVGKSDLGANAKRIRRLYELLERP